MKELSPTLTIYDHCRSGSAAADEMKQQISARCIRCTTTSLLAHFGSIEAFCNDLEIWVWRCGCRRIKMVCRTPRVGMTNETRLNFVKRGCIVYRSASKSDADGMVRNGKCTINSFSSRNLQLSVSLASLVRSHNVPRCEFCVACRRKLLTQRREHRLRGYPSRYRDHSFAGRPGRPGCDGRFRDLPPPGDSRRSANPCAIGGEPTGSPISQEPGQ